MRLRGPRSLAAQLFAAQVAVVLVVLTGTGLAAASNAASSNEDAAREEVLALARTVAAMPTVRSAAASPSPSPVLQPLAEEVRRASSTDFVVVMSPAGVRWTHPRAALVGGRFRGTIGPAAAGGTVEEVFAGSLGPSVRAVVPVRSDGGAVVGLVAVGRTVDRVDRELAAQLPLVAGTTALALLLAAAGSWGVSRWLRRTTHDLGPAELGRMYEYYDAVLHAVREGLLLLDRQGRLQLVNDEARRLLELPPDAVGRPIAELAPGLGAALAAGVERTDEIVVTDARVVVVNQAGAAWDGVRLGTVVTLRDHTELRSLVEELETVRGFADALSSQAHESENRMHTVVSLIELGRAEEALRFVTRRIADAQHLTDLVLDGIGEPAVAALVLGKHAEAAEQGVELTVAEDVDLPAGAADPDDLVTIVGNLLDNAIDAAAGSPAPRSVRFASLVLPGPSVEITVADSGPGLPPGAARDAFVRGWSTKSSDRLHGRGLGLALVARAVHRNGGDVRATPTPTGTLFTVHLPHAPIRA